MEVLAAKKLNFQLWSWQLWNWFNAGAIFPALGKIGRVSEMVCFHRALWFGFKSQSKEAISVHQQLMVVIGLMSSLASPLIFCPCDMLLQKKWTTPKIGQRPFSFLRPVLGAQLCTAGYGQAQSSVCKNTARRRLCLTRTGTRSPSPSPWHCSNCVISFISEREGFCLRNWTGTWGK